MKGVSDEWSSSDDDSSGRGSRSRARGTPLSCLKRVEDVVMQMLESLQASGYDEDECREIREHFARLPSRYTFKIDPHKHEAILLHMELLMDAREAEYSSSCTSYSDSSTSTPIVHVRKVQLAGFNEAVHPRPAFGSFANHRVLNEDGYLGEQDDPLALLGYEITIATTNRPGLFKFFTSALSDSDLQLNIKEAHVFSTTDEMALQVFVVDGWLGDKAENELKQAVLAAFDEESESRRNRLEGSRLQAAVEALQYEDWAVDFNQLEFGDKLGNGSTGRLYKGTYLTQDVAIKILDMDECSSSSGSDSDSQRSSSSASERLQTFQQEISIMRLVRHKNVVQFIGACSKWPKLCIVTELMDGGSVRDLLDHRRGGLDISSAVKVLRDTARGMDFLHKRGIVHRDVKAANILIDEHNVVKVCDLGVARLKPTSINPAENDNCYSAEMTAEIGTYRWMSPEVLEHKSYSHKADVYSFGITMWEVLTGDVPYSRLTPIQAAVGVIRGGLRPDIPPRVPQAIAALMQRCWHKNSNERPEFSEILRILEKMVISPPTSKRGVFSKRKTMNTCFQL